MRKKTNKQTSKLLIYLSFVKLYFSSNFNYVQFNHINLDIKVPALPSAPHVRLPNRPCVSSRTHPSCKKEAILRGRAQKKCASINPRKKWRKSPKKVNLLISDAPEIKWVLVICVLLASEHTDATLKCHSMCVVKRHHTHNSVFYFLLYFLLPLLHHIFCTI